MSRDRCPGSPETGHCRGRELTVLTADQQFRVARILNTRTRRLAGLSDQVHSWKPRLPDHGENEQGSLGRDALASTFSSRRTAPSLGPAAMCAHSFPCRPPSPGRTTASRRRQHGPDTTLERDYRALNRAVTHVVGEPAGRVTEREYRVCRFSSWCFGMQR